VIGAAGRAAGGLREGARSSPAAVGIDLDGAGNTPPAADTTMGAAGTGPADADPTAGATDPDAGTPRTAPARG